mmetsp:Transcript_13147/g.19335  ORF Transcript_13147/g.19335 Transcript_13147/m.19335 type:complete len:352 (-) Transcript_13147:196-1251(-)
MKLSAFILTLSFIIASSHASFTGEEVPIVRTDFSNRQLRGQAGKMLGNPADINPQIIEDALEVGVPLKTIMHLSNTVRVLRSKGASIHIAPFSTFGRKLANEAATPDNNNNDKTFKQEQYQEYVTNRGSRALSKAVMSAFRDPEGRVDPELLNAALGEGVPVETFLRSLSKLFEQKQRSLLKRIDDVARRCLQGNHAGRKLIQTPQNDFLEPDAISVTGMKLLAKAVLSGYRSVTGEMDEHLVEAAVQEGVPRELMFEVLKKTRRDTHRDNKEEEEEEKGDEEEESSVKVDESPSSQIDAADDNNEAEEEDTEESAKAELAMAEVVDTNTQHDSEESPNAVVDETTGVATQ